MCEPCTPRTAATAILAATHHTALRPRMRKGADQRPKRCSSPRTVRSARGVTTWASDASGPAALGASAMGRAPLVGGTTSGGAALSRHGERAHNDRAKGGGGGDEGGESGGEGSEGGEGGEGGEGEGEGGDGRGDVEQTVSAGEPASQASVDASVDASAASFAADADTGAGAGAGAASTTVRSAAATTSAAAASSASASACSATACSASIWAPACSAAPSAASSDAASLARLEGAGSPDPIPVPVPVPNRSLPTNKRQGIACATHCPRAASAPVLSVLVSSAAASGAARAPNGRSHARAQAAALASWVRG